MTTDNYQSRKNFFNQLLTIYGRKPVHEALHTQGVEIYRLHLAESNKPAKILNEIISQAEAKGAEILYHDRKALSFISKNQKQDQGVAVDLKLKGFEEFDEFVKSAPQSYELLTLDQVTNPQNLGMVIRSVCASPMTALLIPRKGCAKLDSLVIKASAGTLFKARVIRCDALPNALAQLKQQGANIIGMDANAEKTIRELECKGPIVFVLGNETEGLSQEVAQLCNVQTKIPMLNGVESLNVAVTASLIAFRSII